MENIEFRIWDKDCKKMFDQKQVIIMLDKDGIDTCFDIGSEYMNTERLGINKEDLIYMQYTGMKDTSGRKIFEGDIILTESGNEYRVVKNKFSFKVQDNENLNSNLYLLEDYMGYGMIVIGNIYSNDCEVN